MKSRKLLQYAVMGVAAACIATFLSREKKTPEAEPRDYPEIAAEGVLRVATEYNSISFFVDGDTISGFHYELINAFARDHGLKAVITPEMSFEERLKGLEEDRFDVIANSILATSELKDSLLLTTPLVLNRQVLVQRKPTAEGNSLFIRNQLELAGKTLHVVKGSPSMLRIQNLSNEIADTIYIKEVEKYGSEQLIALVAHGDIDYAVCDESIAQAVADSLPQIDYSTAISFTQFYSWGVSKHSPALLDSLNRWIEHFKSQRAYKKLYRKYYGSKR